jgi:prevent-host-death family protein
LKVREESKLNSYSIRELRVRIDELVRSAEAGEPFVVTKDGQPLFIALPFADTLLANGVMVSLAAKLFRDHVVSLGKAAELAGMTKVKFFAALGAFGIPAVGYPASDLVMEHSLLGVE